MVKIWGSSKNDQNQITGKFIFTILHFIVAVVVAVVVVVLLLLLLQFRLAYLNNQRELRNETLRTDRYP